MLQYGCNVIGMQVCRDGGLQIGLWGFRLGQISASSSAQRLGIRPSRFRHASIFQQCTGSMFNAVKLQQLGRALQVEHRFGFSRARVGNDSRAECTTQSHSKHRQEQTGPRRPVGGHYGAVKHREASRALQSRRHHIHVALRRNGDPGAGM